MKELLTLKVNERGALTIHLPDGEQLPGINGIKVKQDLSKMKRGFAEVKLSMLVKTIEEEGEKILNQAKQPLDNYMTKQKQKP
jgi:hypothetical protein